MAPLDEPFGGGRGRPFEVTPAREDDERRRSAQYLKVDLGVVGDPVSVGVAAVVEEGEHRAGDLLRRRAERERHPGAEHSELQETPRGDLRGDVRPRIGVRPGARDAGEPELDHRVVAGGAARNAKADRRARKGGGLLPETFLGERTGWTTRGRVHRSRHRGRECLLRLHSAACRPQPPAGAGRLAPATRAQGSRTTRLTSAP